MDSHHQVECDIVFNEDVSKFGEFANAFRIVPDVGMECFLDFCLYSSNENRALVVSRIRIHQSFLPRIRERLKEHMTELSPEKQKTPKKDNSKLMLRDGVVTTLDGGLVLFGGVLDEDV